MYRKTTTGKLQKLSKTGKWYYATKPEQVKKEKKQPLLYTHTGYVCLLTSQKILGYADMTKTTICNDGIFSEQWIAARACVKQYAKEITARYDIKLEDDEMITFKDFINIMMFYQNVIIPQSNIFFNVLTSIFDDNDTTQKDDKWLVLFNAVTDEYDNEGITCSISSIKYNNNNNNNHNRHYDLITIASSNGDGKHHHTVHLGHAISRFQEDGETHTYHTVLNAVILCTLQILKDTVQKNKKKENAFAVTCVKNPPKQFITSLSSQNNMTDIQRGNDRILDLADQEPYKLSTISILKSITHILYTYTDKKDFNMLLNELCNFVSIMIDRRTIEDGYMFYVDYRTDVHTNIKIIRNNDNE